MVKSSDLQCIVVTPERTVRDQRATFIALPLFDGEIGIAPGHSPMIGRLGFGEMRINDEQGVHRFYVDGGFVEVIDNVVSVLTNRASPVDELSKLKSMDQLHTALERPAHSEELMAVRDRIVDQARAELRVIRRDKES